MVGVLFIVTIPTELEERHIRLNEKDFGHSSNDDIPNQKNDKFEYGTFKIWSTDGFLMDREFKHDYMNCTGLLNNLSPNSTMECIMTEIFKKFNIDNAVWQLSKNTKYYQITFFVETNVCHELVLSTLNEWGIGQKNGSCMSMIPCAIYSQPKKPSIDEPIGPSTESISQRKQTAWDKFMSSVHARWNVAQIVQRVKSDATITFDFVTLILVAGILASFGLLENNTTTVISSMLISPLMGPVIATIFGIVIKDYALVRFGLVNEVIGILIATCIGFTLGLIICTVDSKYAYGNDVALTTEMISRCEFHSLLFGVLTALPTGAASAIAVLGENFGPIVGVAISVSLLPPAVNAGIFWALAVLYKINEKDETLYGKIVMTSYYSNHQSIELAVYGGISMLLTIANVICIQVVGVLTLKIKEVAPHTTQNQHRLWEHDIKVARNYNKTSQTDDDLTASQQQIFKENLSNMKMKDDQMNRLYRQSYKCNWSEMSPQYAMYGHDSTISDLERISLCMEYPTGSMPIRSQFDTKPIKIQNNRNSNQRSASSISPPSPTSYLSKMSQPRSPSIFSNLQSMSKFRLEKIPEVPPPSLSMASATSSNENHDTNTFVSTDEVK